MIRTTPSGSYCTQPRPGNWARGNCFRWRRIHRFTCLRAYAASPLVEAMSPSHASTAGRPRSAWRAAAMSSSRSSHSRSMASSCASRHANARVRPVAKTWRSLDRSKSLDWPGSAACSEAAWIVTSGSDFRRRNDTGDDGAGDSSVDDQRVAVDPPGLVGGEEQYRAGDVVGIGVPAQEFLDAVEVFLTHRLLEVREDGRLDRTRKHRVDAKPQLDHG